MEIKIEDTLDYAIRHGERIQQDGKTYVLADSDLILLSDDEIKTPLSPPARAKTYLDLPFSQKENVKKAGAKWDSIEKKWFTTTPEVFWNLYNALPPIHEKHKVWLDVPFKSKDIVKRAEARWDGDSKRWYAYEPLSATLRRFTPAGYTEYYTTSEEEGVEGK